MNDNKWSKVVNFFKLHMPLIISFAFICIFTLITILSYGVPGCGGEDKTSLEFANDENDEYSDEDELALKYSATDSNPNIVAQKIVKTLEGGRGEYGLESPTDKYIDVTNFKVPANISNDALSIKLIAGNYKAIPNDKIDDTVALQQAIFLACYNSWINSDYNIYKKGAITIFLPRGKYIISKQLVIDMKGYAPTLAIRMIGDWAHLVVDPSLQAPLESLIDFKYGSAYYVSGFIFDANHKAQHAFAGYKIGGGIFERIVATGALSHGVEIGPTHAIYRKISLFANGGDGLLLKGVNGSDLSEISAGLNKKNGITIETYKVEGTTFSGGCLIENFTSYKNHGDGIHITANSVSLDNVRVVGNHGDGIYIDGSHANVKKTYIEGLISTNYMSQFNIENQRAIRVSANGKAAYFDSNSAVGTPSFAKIAMDSIASTAYFSGKNLNLPVVVESISTEEIPTDSSLFNTPDLEKKINEFASIILNQLKIKKKISNQHIKYFNIILHGATPQSSNAEIPNDDSVAINNAIKAASNNSAQINTINVVYIPRGVYHLQTPIVIDGALLASKKVVILSDFGSIIASPYYSNGDSLLSAMDLKNIVLKRVSMDANKKSDKVFYAENIKNGKSLIEQVAFANSLVGSHFSNTSYIEMVFPVYSNTLEYALYINNSQNFIVRKLQSMHNHGTLIIITGITKFVTLWNTWLEGNNGTQFKIGSNKNNDNISNISIQYGWLEGNNGDMIRLYTGDNINVEGLRILSYNSCFHGTKFMRIYNKPQNIVISGNRMNAAMPCKSWIVDSNGNNYRDCYGSVEAPEEYNSNVQLDGNFDLNQYTEVVKTPVAPSNTKPFGNYPEVCSFIFKIPSEKWPISFDYTPFSSSKFINEHIVSETGKMCKDYKTQNNISKVAPISPSNVPEFYDPKKMMPGFHVGTELNPFYEIVKETDETKSNTIDVLNIYYSLIFFSKNKYFFLYKLPCEDNVNIVGYNPYTMDLSPILPMSNPVSCSDLEDIFDNVDNGDIYYNSCDI